MGNGRYRGGGWYVEGRRGGGREVIYTLVHLFFLGGSLKSVKMFEPF